MHFRFYLYRILGVPVLMSHYAEFLALLMLSELMHRSSAAMDAPEYITTSLRLDSWCKALLNFIFRNPLLLISHRLARLS
jgi:hypothetical protein